jgi:hypothetical protein
MENDAEIFLAHYTWKVTEKGFEMAFMMNKHAMIMFVKLFLKNKNNFFAKNQCEIQLSTKLVCALYSIKYGILSLLYIGEDFGKNVGDSDRLNSPAANFTNIL